MTTDAPPPKVPTYEVPLDDGSVLSIVEIDGGFGVVTYTRGSVLGPNIQPHKDKLRHTSIAARLRLEGPLVKYCPESNSPITVWLNACEDEPEIQVFKGMTGSVTNLRTSHRS